MNYAIEELRNKIEQGKGDRTRLEAELKRHEKEVAVRVERLKKGDDRIGELERALKHLEGRQAGEKAVDNCPDAFPDGKKEWRPLVGMTYADAMGLVCSINNRKGFYTLVDKEPIRLHGDEVRATHKVTVKHIVFGEVTSVRADEVTVRL